VHNCEIYKNKQIKEESLDLHLFSKHVVAGPHRHIAAREPCSKLRQEYAVSPEHAFALWLRKA
jgi:hypothetical protein